MKKKRLLKEEEIEHHFPRAAQFRVNGENLLHHASAALSEGSKKLVKTTMELINIFLPKKIFSLSVYTLPIKE